MKRPDDVIVIGAGIGGLTAACLLARRGRRVTVIEKGRVAGGYAQNFKRGAFTFDATLHSMNGPRDGNAISEIISDCGIKDKVEFIEQKNLYRLITPDFDIRVKNADLEGYVGQLKGLFPREGAGIEALFSEAAKVYESVERLDRSRLPLFLDLVLFPFRYPKLIKYDRHTVERFMRRFVLDERLIAALSALWSFFSLPPGRLAFSYFFFPFIDYLKNGGFAVKGGSETLVRALVESIEGSGGDVITGSGATEILMEGRRAVGVRTESGEFFAGSVITNISPMRTVELAGRAKFKPKYLKGIEARRVALSGVQVYLGLDCALGDLGVSPEDYIIVLMDDYDLEAQYQKSLKNDFRGCGFGITCYGNLDPERAPEGKSTMGLFGLSEGRTWIEMDERTYRAKKAEATDVLIERADRLFPGLSGKIAVKETATPRTMLRYTGNALGSYHGFDQGVDQAGMVRRFPKKYPIKGLYQVGAWTFPGGGYGGVMFSARQLVRRYFS